MSLHIFRNSLTYFWIPCWVDGLELKRIPIHQSFTFQNDLKKEKKKEKKRNKEKNVYFRNMFWFDGAGPSNLKFEITNIYFEKNM